MQRGLIDPGTLAALTAERKNMYIDTVFIPPAAAGRGLMNAYQNAGIMIAQVDTANGWIISRVQQLRGRLGGVALSRFVDCGRTPFGDNTDSYVVEMRISSSVTKGPGASSIIATAMSAAGAAPGNHERTSRCHSTGRLERQLAHLAETLAQPPSK